MKHLVTVGIPTYNRPEGLSRTLASISGQSYKNLQILVSDNCSTDSRVQETIRQWECRDARIVGVRQESNIGPMANFQTLAIKADGSFFMWAADDDVWEPFFIEGLTDVLTAGGQDLAAANYEAQYFVRWPGKLPFFPEGVPFYSFMSHSPYQRVWHMLRYSYGNLFYSLYRKDILIESLHGLAYNEIPFFVQVSSRGNWKVLNKVGLYKQTNIPTYRQARWEIMGGFLRPKFSGFRGLMGTVGYHCNAGRRVRSAIFSLNLDAPSRRRLAGYSNRLLRRHLLRLACCFKKPNTSA